MITLLTICPEILQTGTDLLFTYQALSFGEANLKRCVKKHSCIRKAAANIIVYAALFCVSKGLPASEAASTMPTFQLTEVAGEVVTCIVVAVPPL